jgi:hypothetical protein
MPGAQYALNIVHPASPVLRIRYRDGVLVDPYGFPDWVLYARALVELPDPEPGLGVDEMRVLDVLAANQAPSDDPLLAGQVGTPAGWCWAHIGRTRQLALVPIELHGCYRHGGGVRTMAVTASKRGLRGATVPVAIAPGDRTPADVLDDLERLLERRLPTAYRRYLAETNGAAPIEPAVLAGYGFVVDQPLFGLARADQHQDLGYVRDFLTDRFADDLLPIGYVQGGILAIGPAGDVFYWDDDDVRDDASYGVPEIRDRLLHRCADDFDDFRRRLVAPPGRLLDLADVWTITGRIRPVHHDLAGAGLPPTMRAPWQTQGGTGRHPIAKLFELT